MDLEQLQLLAQLIDSIDIAVDKLGECYEKKPASVSWQLSGLDWELIYQKQCGLIKQSLQSAFLNWNS